MRRLPSACRGGCVRGRATPAGVYGARAEKSCSRAWGLPCRVVPGEDDSGRGPSLPDGLATGESPYSMVSCRNFPLGPSTARPRPSGSFFRQDPLCCQLFPLTENFRTARFRDRGLLSGPFLCPVLSSVRSFPCPALSGWRL